MIWRNTGLACCLVGYGVGWLAEVAGARALLAPLVVIPVLLVLLAGGNWLQHWLGIERASPKFSEPAPRDEHESTDTEPS
ncbi:MAG TPA: hypothetical protein VMQ40_00070 [Acidimicrobiales bacterium]|nr:hypothetical protein [Acidimicrobiales bacterium]